ncbi:hypothetical protein HN588_06090 [Candidatus Bathyarchaeota archaeon]|jgi:hypothetical protein|nr:hypothetical protein [Candidatus Bathyarchaeota archaeon]
MKLTTNSLKKIIKEELGRMVANRPIGEMNDMDYYGKYGSPEQDTQTAIDTSIEMLEELVREMQGHYDPDKVVSPEQIINSLTRKRLRFS